MGRPRLRLSVTSRIALLAIALALISNVVLVAFVWRQIHDDAIDAVRRDTTEQAESLVAVYRSGGLPALTRAIDATRAPPDRSLVAFVIDAHGRRIAGRGPDRLSAALAPTGTFRVAALGSDGAWAGREAGYVVRPIGGDRLISGRLLDDWQEEQRGIERALGLAMILSLSLGVIGGLVVARYVGRRLNGIAGVIDGVGQGDLSRRVGTAGRGAAQVGGDAFDRLSSRLDMMLDKVERLMAELRIVTDGLAHDLRSPIARLRGKTETALLATDPAQREAALNGLLVETDLVMRMLTTLLEISRSQSVSRDRFSAIDPVDLVAEIGELYEPVAEDAGSSLAVIVDGRPATIVLHRELMTQAITNLIDNALRHAGGQGAITLRLTARGGDLRLAVEDRGPGIAAGDRAQALSRFGRLDRARTIPGAGLGLSLVAAVAGLHGGRLELDDNAPGLVATIVLPLAGP